MNRYHKQAIVAGVLALLWSVWPADFGECMVKHGAGKDTFNNRNTMVFRYCRDQSSWGW